MKVNRKRIFVLTLAAALLLTPVSAFAAGKTVNVNGREDTGVKLDSISVTNVTKELDPKATEEYLDAFFEVDAPCVITTLRDSHGFSAEKMKKEGESFTSSGKVTTLKGSTQIRVPNPEDVMRDLIKTVDLSTVDPDTQDVELVSKGATATLTEPGYYSISTFIAEEGSTDIMILVKGTASNGAAPATPTAPAVTPTAPAETPAAVTKADAKATASKVLVNSAATSFEAYNINGNNYFKLRDIAKVVSGTTKQFDVEYNADVKAINLLSSKAYTAVGGEMAAGDGTAKSATLNTSKIYKDGTEIALTAYNIGGNNYFKLRDLASAFNIGVTWDGTTNTVGIDTSLEYTE
ncbi:MAG: copper amine oxidase-like protein [Bacillota bacterium]|nr:copper amine oxidase-like protein [Bacillota bacterium]